MKRFKLLTNVLFTFIRSVLIFFFALRYVVNVLACEILIQPGVVPTDKDTMMTVGRDKYSLKKIVESQWHE